MTQSSSPSDPTPLRQASAGETRKLLRALRDVNSAERFSVRSGYSVALAGCLSLDGPVEQGVRYRLKLPDGTLKLLSIEGNGSVLEIELRETGEPAAERSHVAELLCDDDGRALAPSLRARWSQDDTGARGAEHFLRRVVRGLYAA